MVPPVPDRLPPSGPTQFEDPPMGTAARVLADDALSVRHRSETANRLLNVAVAAVALVVMLPVMLVIGLVVRLTSDGPIIYTQVRVGRDRRSPSDQPDQRRTRDHGGRL